MEGLLLLAKKTHQNLRVLFFQFHQALFMCPHSNFQDPISFLLITLGLTADTTQSWDFNLHYDSITHSMTLWI